MEENQTLKKKLEYFSQNNAQVTATDMKKTHQLKEKTSSELRKRKRICSEMIDQILEGYPKGKKALYEEVGIEPD